MRIYRIKDWLHFLGLPLLGCFLDSSISENFLLGLTLAFFLLAFAYALNEYFDCQLDKSNQKYLFIPFLSLILLNYFGDSSQRIASLIFLLIAIFYSWPRIGLKKIPFLGTLSNAVAFPLLIFLGKPAINQRTIAIYFLFFVLMLVAQLIHELAHQQEDSKRKILTTALCIGEERTKRAIQLSLLLSLVIAFSFYKWISIFLLFFLVYLSWMFKRGKIDYLSLRIKYRLFGICLGIIILFYLWLR